MYSEFLNKLRNKYNYDEDLMKAIEISIPIMVDTYGEDSISQILKLFEDVRIFATKDMTKQNRENIESQMIGNVNSHIKKEDTNPYGTDIDPGAYYSYELVFDKDMNIKGEVRWIVANKGNLNSQGYKDLFGTTINMPYFLHELNHAYAMQTPIFKKEGNQISVKHGMYMTKLEYKKNTDAQVELKTIGESDIILEEMVNEMYTQRQLIKLLNKNDYKEVREALRTINHVPTSYSQILIMLSENLEKLIGNDNLKQYRENNDMSIRDEFANLSSKSEIYNKYLKDEGINCWDYFSLKCFEIFEISSNSYKMSVADYEKKQRKLMVDAFIALSSYREVKLGTIDLDKFEEIRNSILGEEVKQKEESKQY